MTTTPRISRCRSCGAEVVWAITRNGKRMILDARPARLFVLAPSPREEIERKISDAGDRRDSDAVDRLVAELDQADTTPGCRQIQAYTPHWATCPNAEQHRRGKR